MKVQDIKQFFKDIRKEQAEIQELLDNCSITNTSQNGVTGRLIVGPNGRWIFLPAAGIIETIASSEYENILWGTGSTGGYWSSSLNADNPNQAWAILFDGSFYFDLVNSTRYFGRSVRPVCD